MRLAEIRPRHVAAFVTVAERQGSIVDHPRPLACCTRSSRPRSARSWSTPNPAEAAERPKAIQRRWRILEPAEVARVATAFTDDQARAVFLTLILTGVRRFEAPGAALA